MNRRALPTRALGSLPALASVLVLAFGCGRGPAPPPAPSAAPSLTPQTSGTTALLQAVSAVDERVVWIGGHRGTFARTVDGGARWGAGRVPGADTLQFRDVHAVSADVAYLMSAGSGELSRIYKTTDGGRSWTLQFTNREPEGFFDCMDFWDAERGLAFSDAVGGRMFLVRTENGGARWDPVPADRLPPALPGEGGFAASGTCLVTGPGGRAWVGMGNADTARVLRTDDGGRSWSVAPTPLPGGQAAGITSIAFRDTRHGIVLGGELGKPDGRGDYVAVTDDGGRTWRPAGRPAMKGAVYGGAYLPGDGAPMVVAVGPGGIDYSPDDGTTWTSLDTLPHWGVGFASRRVGWAVGPNGRITKISFR
ncbi:MAG TPA: hypothetical protein VNK43_12710 [Gemmatimonadales bacterium]|nr:hypothetical protein [Gemmatimonadales bacterium]